MRFCHLGRNRDLTRRKLIPALYQLLASEKIGHFALVGVSLMPTTIYEVLEQAKPFIPHIDPTVWQKLVSASYYLNMDFHDNARYIELHKLIATVEKKHHLKGNRLFY